MSATRRRATGRLLRRLAWAMFMPAAALAAPSAKQRCIEAAEDGQSLRQEGKLSTAVERFRACSASECPRMLQKDCSHWLEEVEAAIPTVTVKVEDEDGREVQNAHVTLDAHQWSLAEGRARRVDPGPHRFVWVREAEAAIEETVTLREGEQNRVITLRAPRRVATRPSEAPKRSISPWVWVGYGLGLAAVGTGAGFWAYGLDQRGTLQDTCAATRTCLESDIGASRDNLVVGDIVMGVGIVALAGATYLLMRDLTRKPADPPLTSGAGGGALRLGGGAGGTTLDGRSGPRITW